MFLEKNKCCKTCTLNHQLKINDLFINVIYNSKFIYFCIGTYEGIHGMCQIAPKQSVKTERKSMERLKQHKIKWGAYDNSTERIFCDELEFSVYE